MIFYSKQQLAEYERKKQKKKDKDILDGKNAALVRHRSVEERRKVKPLCDF